jgi:hypothetical protein
MTGEYGFDWSSSDELLTVFKGWEESSCQSMYCLFCYHNVYRLARSNSVKGT